MKATAFQIFASILLIFAYLVTMRINPEEKEDEMARIIPHSILLYLEQKNGGDALKKFAASRFGQSLESIDLMAVAREVGVQDDSLDVLKEILDIYKIAKENPLLHGVMGKKAALVLMEPVDSYPAEDLRGFLQENIIVVARPENMRRWIDKSEGPAADDDENPVLSTTQYGTYRIMRVLLGNQPFSLVLLKGFAVMSQNEKHVRRCIDTVDGELPALTADPDFQEIGRRFSDPESFLYLPMGTLRRFTASIAERSGFTGKNLLLKGLRSTAGFNGLGYLAWRKKEKIEKQIFIRFNRREVSEFARHYVETPPVSSPMVSLTSQDPMLFYWSNTLNFRNVSMYIEEAAQSDPRLAEFLARLKKVTGRDASSTLALFGREASMIVEEGPRDALFPFPLGLFCIRLEKIAEFKDVMDKLLQSYDLPLKEEEYGSAWFRYWSRGPQDGLFPLYGFWQDYFFFGNSTMLLRRVIDTHGDRISMADVAAARKIDPGISGRNNSVSYLNNVQLISMVGNFLEVLGTFVAIEDRETAMKIRIVLKKVVNPLLDGATMYRASAARSHIDGEMLTIDSITDISNNPSTSRK